MIPIRSKQLNTRLTAEEYAAVERAAGGDPLSEWARTVLVSGAKTSRPDASVVLAEILALRSLTLNLLYRIGSGQQITAEDMQRLIDRADAEKGAKAAARLATVPAGHAR